MTRFSLVCLSAARNSCPNSRALGCALSVRIVNMGVRVSDLVVSNLAENIVLWWEWFVGTVDYKTIQHEYY
jgi:hypothetical protein